MHNKIDKVMHGSGCAWRKTFTPVQILSNFTGGGGGGALVWHGQPLTQKAREKGSGDQLIPVLFHWSAAVGTRLLKRKTMMAMAALDVNKLHPGFLGNGTTLV